MDIEEVLLSELKKRPTKDCIDLSKHMIGYRNGFIYFTESFRIDFENKMSELARYKKNSIPREKIEKKIKELQYENKGPIAVHEYRENGIKIEVLQGLLEDK